MSQQNVDATRRAAEAWNSGGIEAILQFYSEDAIWYPFPDSPDIASGFHGHDAIRELMKGWTDSFDDYSVVADEIRDYGEKVVVLGEMAGHIKGSSIPVRQPLGIVAWDFRGDQIGRASFFPSWEEALEAVQSRENVEVIRGMYERWFQGDPSLFEAFDPEIELHPDPSADWVGVDDVYRGHAGIRSYMRQVYEALEDYRPEVEELRDVGDKVLTLAIEHGRGRGSGAVVEARQTAHVWTMRANRAIRGDLYLDRSRALDALGLTE
jgi:ketosteroid isomerase-like protein